MKRDLAGLDGWLSDFLTRNGGVAGTIHLRSGDFLELAAAVNIPPKVQELTARIPRGRGMAGIALERGKAVQTCNLQDDSSGDVRPGARAVDAKAAVAIPVRGPSSEIRAIVGIAFGHERELSKQEIAEIAEDSATLP